MVPYEDGAAAASEIERCAPDPAYAQVFMLTRSSEPAGNRRYWPIYEAAARHGLPVALHVFGASGHPYTGAGWPSYYVEEGAGHSTSCQTVVTSLVIEGVFERFPSLKVVIVEGGFAWLAPLAWRLDKLYARMRGEVAHLKRKPSEYIREHIWVTTQPMEEPADRTHALDMMEWIGWDRLLFASDYPHWDFDDPFRAFPAGMPRERSRQILTANAKAVYRLGRRTRKWARTMWMCRCWSAIQVRQGCATNNRQAGGGVTAGTRADGRNVRSPHRMPLRVARIASCGLFRREGRVGSRQICGRLRRRQVPYARFLRNGDSYRLQRPQVPCTTAKPMPEFGISSRRR